MAEIRHLVHPFKPIIDKDCKVLILGSVPSVKSCEEGFYYMHKSNRFWKVIGNLTNENFEVLNFDKRREVLLKHHIALYDAVYECEIKGSSDSSAKIIKATNIKELIKGSNVKSVFCNGKLSYNIATKYNEDIINMIDYLPSTSPANAVKRLEDLNREWKDKLGDIL